MLSAHLTQEKHRLDSSLGEDLREIRANGSSSYTVLRMQQRYEKDIEDRLSILLNTLPTLLAAAPKRDRQELDQLARDWLRSHIEDCQSRLNEHAARIGFPTANQFDLGRDRVLKALAARLYLLSRTVPLGVPSGVEESLGRFRRDYTDSDKVAFLMMRFGKTKAHESIVAGIRAALDPQGIAVLRADDKQYHDDLFPNVLTYIYGCRFGIAVFERIETEEFNPNVALEVGYMFALRKEVCLLKDRTLKTLQTDLVGKLYKEFDPQDPVATIPNELSRWLIDKDLTSEGAPNPEPQPDSNRASHGSAG